ncbi:hypothetical protein FTO74_13480 [Granulicella sp. WH15]|uniref:hypothetical protein n=1 Tax=Granulicella sp. WH15 TaxID=2602070 RepID=UPI001367947B|nr:hypothetical protein [Granulicella sp. WH15]QHN04259.1 hypothetical protein FTO74_13480 [Granulicella sp. WH15]
MAKKTEQRSFNDVLSILGSQKFDVAPASEGAKRGGGAFQVRKYGCAAEIGAGSDGSVQMLARPGWVLGGEISRLVDKGYQKFLVTPKVSVPATADALRAIHEFSQELNLAAGEMNLYNEALGTTSDRYMYDRVKGRPDAG